MTFETEYQLEEFRQIEKEHFDERGNAYKLYVSTHLCERMLKLINQLESELNGKSDDDIFRITCQAMNL